MEITEKELEDMIFKDLNTEGMDLSEIGLDIRLNKPNLPNKVYWRRQVCLGDYGRADIIGFARGYGWIYVDIIELKNKPITAADFEQLLRYKSAVKEILHNTFKSPDYDISCILIGPSIESGHFIQENARCQLFTFEFTLRGFQFSGCSGWHRGKGKLTFRDIFPSKTLNITKLLTNGQEVH